MAKKNKETRYMMAIRLIHELNIKPSTIEENTGGTIPASWVRGMVNYNANKEYADRLDMLVDHLLDVSDFKKKQAKKAEKEES